MKKTLLTCLFAMTSLGLTGCGAEGDPADEAAAADEIGVLEEALCTDAAATNASLPMNISNGAETASTSPTSTYGTSACTGHYVVEVTNTLGRNITPFATWGEALPGTEQACPFALLEAEAWGWVPSKKIGSYWTLPYWKYLGKQTAGGHMVGGGIFTPWCAIGTGFAQIVNSPYSKIRVSAKAAALAVFFTVPKKVKAGIQNEVIIY